MARSILLLAPGLIAAWLAACSSFPTSDSATGRTANEFEAAGAVRSAAVLRAAAEFLWSRQSPDGAWRSETYGLLKTGQALTPFVLHSLLQVPEAVFPRPAGGVERALEFLRRAESGRGAVGLANPDVLEYPNYATALALRCFLQAGKPGDKRLVARMRSYLIREQFAEARGFDASMAAYGGWGFGGAHAPGQTGHSDVSHVRHALEAMREAGAPADVFRRAERYLAMIQKDPHDERPQPSLVPEVERRPNREIYDGGFYISPVILNANKGQPPENNDPAHWHSYASATCDGVLALFAAGVTRDDRRMRDAANWLRKHPRLDYPEGIPPVSDKSPLPWGEAIRYYHYAVRAQAYAALLWPGEWREELAEQLARRQRPDGGFANEASPLMKEDDPLVATALAVRALTAR